MSTRILEKIAIEVTESPPIIQKMSKKKSFESSKNFEIGEKVLAFDGIWLYYATILSQELEMNRNKKGYRVHWEGWPDSDDEDLTTDFILKLNKENTSFKAQVESLDYKNGYNKENLQSKHENKSNFFQDEKVMVYWSGQIYSAKIIEIDKRKQNDIQYKIRYLTWGKSADEWLGYRNVYKVTAAMEELKMHLKKCKLLVENERKIKRVSDVKAVHAKKSKRKLETFKNEEDKTQATDEGLINDLFTAKPFAKIKEMKDLFSNNVITIDKDDNFDDLNVDTHLKKYASKRSLLKRIKELKKENKELRCSQTEKFCLKCKKYYDFIAKEKGMKKSSEALFIYKGKIEKKESKTGSQETSISKHT